MHVRTNRGRTGNQLKSKHSRNKRNVVRERVPHKLGPNRLDTVPINCVAYIKVCTGLLMATKSSLLESFGSLPCFLFLLPFLYVVSFRKSGESDSDLLDLVAKFPPLSERGQSVCQPPCMPKRPFFYVSSSLLAPRVVPAFLRLNSKAFSPLIKKPPGWRRMY